MTALEKKQKKISVIIPVYNAEKYLRETLDSVIKQSYNNWEILLIENGSKDKSPGLSVNTKRNIRESICSKDLEKARGLPETWGLGLRKVITLYLQMQMIIFRM